MSSFSYLFPVSLSWQTEVDSCAVQLLVYLIIYLHRLEMIRLDSYMNSGKEAQRQHGRWWDGCFLRPGDEAPVLSGKVCTRTSLSFCLCSPAFSLSPLLSSLDAACVFLSTEGSSAWIIRLRCYWCIKLRVWFLSRPCHQSQFARALAECNISLIGSTRKLRSWTVLIREEIIKLGAPGKITLWALL